MTRPTAASYVYLTGYFQLGWPPTEQQIDSWEAYGSADAERTPLAWLS